MQTLISNLRSDLFYTRSFGVLARWYVEVPDERFLFATKGFYQEHF